MNYAPRNGCKNKTGNINRRVNVEERKSHRTPPLDKELQATVTAGEGTLASPKDGLIYYLSMESGQP